MLWIAGTSAFLLTGFASGPDDSSGYIVAGQLTQIGHAASRIELKADEAAAMPPNPKTSAAASTLNISTIDSASFNDRFGGPVTDALRISARPSEFIGRVW
ncbi:hypothetical protein [Rhizobium leguminosarum]